MSNWTTIIEAPAYHRAHLRPHIAQTPVMSCIETMIPGDNADDLRCSASGEPLCDLRPLGHGDLLIVPRPEVHPAAEDWSFARMRGEGRFAFIAFWIHPAWGGPKMHEAIARRLLDHTRWGGTGEPNLRPRPSTLHKPDGYLHTLRDLGTPHGLATLVEVRAALDAFAARMLGVRLGEEGVRAFVQYPSGDIKSTFHIHLAFGPETEEEELGRRTDLDLLIASLRANLEAADHWVWAYRLHHASGVYRLTSKMPLVPLAPGVALVGVAEEEGEVIAQAARAWRHFGARLLATPRVTWSDVEALP